MALPVERAVGTIKLAREFADAASECRLDPHGPPRLVVYFLVGHSLELALKSVLIVDGTSERRLKKIGHDLVECLKEARSALPEDIVGLGAEEAACFELIAPFYKAKAFEYLKPGFRELPLPGDAVELAAQLVDRIQPWVNLSVRHRLGVRNAG